MADQKDKFVNSMLGAFAVAERKLKSDDVDGNELNKALKELRRLLNPVARNHFGELQSRLNYSVGDLFPILHRMACQWYKQFMRRMTTRCSVKNPWKVVLEVSVPFEIFGIFKDIVYETNFGVYTHKTKSKCKKCVMAFTSRLRVANLFLRLMESDMPKEDFLQKKFKSQKRIGVIISEEKQFGLLYNYNKEMICFDFSYGFWNDHGFPQHL